MAKTYKGWTRINRDNTTDNFFTKWVREGYPTITDYADDTGKGWCDPEDRYQVAPAQDRPYESYIYRSFARLSDAILYAETGKYRWQVSSDRL